jgi:xanthine dehydrogenase iron-sulfur cluster and FAD-binding subunit A
VPALIAGAAPASSSAQGTRECLVESICTGPGRTSLAKGEFIVEFNYRRARPHQCDAYLRFIPRTEMDIAVVGCGGQRHARRKGVCTDARVVLGAVAPTGLVEDAAKALIGHKLDEATLAALDAAAQAACKPITTSAARSNIAPRSPACCAPHGRHRVRSRRGKTRKGSLSHEQASRIHHHQRRADRVLCEPQQTLLDVLRDELGLTGSKEGCARATAAPAPSSSTARMVCSCLCWASRPRAHGHHIEGIAQGDKLHPVQQKFPGARRAAMRLLHAGPDRRHEGVARRESQPDRNRGALLAGRQPVPLHRL